MQCNQCNNIKAANIHDFASQVDYKMQFETNVQTWCNGFHKAANTHDFASQVDYKMHFKL